MNEIKQRFQELFYFEDTAVLDLVFATVISTYVKSMKPIWLLIIGPSSGGKSEIINLLFKLNFVHEVSDMTENTLLSGMYSKGEEASLLIRIGNIGVIAMKDFTSILSMRKEKAEVIMAQLRHVYDGRFAKKTGSGRNPDWVGKINFVGGVTEAIHGRDDESASMGRRNIYYCLPEQDRKKTTRAAIRNKEDKDFVAKIEELQIIVEKYINEQITSIPQELPAISHEVEDNLVELADFSTHARTPTKRNFKGQLTLATSLEMPMRMVEQLHGLAKTLQFMYREDGGLPEQTIQALYRIGLDSIPKNRRIALNWCSTYNKINTKQFAIKIKFPTETARMALEDLNVLGILERKEKTRGEGPADNWIIKEEFRQVMFKYEKKLIRIDADLVLDEEESDEIDPTQVEFSDPTPEEVEKYEKEFEEEQKIL